MSTLKFTVKQEVRSLLPVEREMFLNKVKDRLVRCIEDRVGSGGSKIEAKIKPEGVELSIENLRVKKQKDTEDYFFNNVSSEEYFNRVSEKEFKDKVFDGAAQVTKELFKIFSEVKEQFS